MEKKTEQNTNRENQEPQENTTGAGTKTSEEEASQTPSTIGGEADAQSMPYRPLTRIERRNLWLKEYGDQDFALQMWVRLVEQQDLDVEMMFQMQGLLVFGVMVSTARYAQFFHALLVAGVYPPPSQFEAWFLSLAHTEADVAQIVEAAERAFRDTPAR